MGNTDTYNSTFLDKPYGVAIIGSIENIPTLVIDDVPCALSHVPHKIERLKIEDGVAHVQYITATGKLVEEKINLSSDPESVLAEVRKNEKTEEALAVLRKLMRDNDITPDQVVSSLVKHEGLKKELSKEKEISQKYFELQNKFHLLESEIKIAKESLGNKEQKIRKLENDLSEKSKIISEIEKILKQYTPKKGLMVSNKIHEEVHNLMSNVLGLKKYIEEKIIPEVVVKKNNLKRNPEPISFTPDSIWR